MGKCDQASRNPAADVVRDLALKIVVQRRSAAAERRAVMRCFEWRGAKRRAPHSTWYRLAQFAWMMAQFSKLLHRNGAVPWAKTGLMSKHASTVRSCQLAREADSHLTEWEPGPVNED